MNNRQKGLLKAIVENYVKIIKLVGSNAFCQIFNCSSATVGNSSTSRTTYLAQNYTVGIPVQYQFID